MLGTWARPNPSGQPIMRRVHRGARFTGGIRRAILNRPNFGTMNGREAFQTSGVDFPSGFRARRGLNWSLLGLLYMSYYMCR